MHNAADLIDAMRNGGLNRCEVGAVEVPPMVVGASGQPQHWRSVRMTGTKLGGLTVSALDARQWQARGVVLRAFRAEGAQLIAAHFSACQAQESQWTGAWLLHCSWVETPLTNAQFGRSVLQGCRFAESDLNHVQWAEAALLDCQFADSHQGGAVLDNANLAGAVLCRVDLRRANLFRANFAGAVLVGVDLRGANLTSAVATGALLWDCLLDGADGAGPLLSAQRATEHDPSALLARLQQLPPQVVARMAASLLLRPGQPDLPDRTVHSPSPADASGAGGGSASSPAQASPAPAARPAGTAAASAPPVAPVGLEID